MNLDINKYAVLHEPSIRAAIRKFSRSGEALNKTDISALSRFYEMRTSVYSRGRSAAVINWQLKRHAADAFFFFVSWKPNADAANAAADRSGAAGAAAAHTTSGNSCDAAEPPVCYDSNHDAATASGRGIIKEVAAPAIPWQRRKGSCRLLLELLDASSTEWAAMRPFLLAVLGDPVFNRFQWYRTSPVKQLATELHRVERTQQVKMCSAASAAGFVANVSARGMSLPKREPALRVAVGALLLFCAEVDAIVDADFECAARKAADAGKTETEEFIRRWCVVSGSQEYDTFAKEHPDCKDKDVESPCTSLEFFCFFKHVRPALFSSLSRSKRTAVQQPAQ